jgi:hypothetical protein
LHGGSDVWLPRKSYMIMGTGVYFVGGLVTGCYQV